MGVSRRDFLACGKSLLIAAALPLQSFAAAEATAFGSSKTLNLGAATMQSFQPWLNSTFTVQGGPDPNIFLTLLSAREMNSVSASQPNSQAVDTFALHFGGTGNALEQGTYELQHHALGSFQLFLVPLGSTKYVAVISHLLSGRILPRVNTHRLPVRTEAL
jgi:hypothetical protein